MMEWFLAREGLAPMSPSLWWGAFRGVWRQLASVYITDVIWYAATGELIQGVYAYPCSDDFRAECKAYIAEARA